MTRFAAICYLLLAISNQLASAGASAESSSADRGQYLAGKGQVIPADEVKIYSYVASIDYDYPDPSGVLGVNLQMGNSSYSVKGQEAILQIGLQGKRIPYEDVAPMNLSYVIDLSGSMSTPDKIDWARMGLEALLNRLRSKDTLSVIAYAELVNVILPATPIPQIDKQIVIESIWDELPYGKADHVAGLTAGMNELRATKRAGSVNRVIFVSDCLGAPDGLLDLASEIGSKGANVTAIGVGAKADMSVINALGERSGGSSRFLSSVEKVEETFGPDLDRMLIPSAKNIEIDLHLMPNAEVVETWGYNAEMDGRHVRYTHHTLHNRDYETIMARIALPAVASPGDREIAALTISYEDVSGKREGPERYEITTTFSAITPDLVGLSLPTVLQANTALRAALSLKEIGTLHESIPLNRFEQNNLSAIGWTNRKVTPEPLKTEMLDGERRELQNAIRFKQQRCLDLSLEMRKEIRYIRMLLGTDVLESERDIFDAYVDLFGREISLNASVIAGLIAQPSLRVTSRRAVLSERLDSFIEELVAPFRAPPGAPRGAPRGPDHTPTIMYAGFREDSSVPTDFGAHVTNVVRNALDHAELVAPLDEYLDVISAARDANADYAISGSIIDMKESVAIIGKVFRMPGADLIAVSYAVLPREGTVGVMLDSP